MVHGPLRRVSRLRVSASPEVSCLASCVSRVSASGEAPEGLQECIPSGSSFVVRRLLFGGPDRERERVCVWKPRCFFGDVHPESRGLAFKLDMFIAWFFKVTF